MTIWFIYGLSLWWLLHVMITSAMVRRSQHGWGKPTLWRWPSGEPPRMPELITFWDLQNSVQNVARSMKFIGIIDDYWGGSGCQALRSSLVIVSTSQVSLSFAFSFLSFRFKLFFPTLWTVRSFWAFEQIPDRCRHVGFEATLRQIQASGKWRTKKLCCPESVRRSVSLCFTEFLDSWSCTRK